MKRRIRSAPAVVALALSAALAAPATATAQEQAEPVYSYILSRQSTATLANTYADNQAAVTTGGVLGGADAAALPFCAGPQAAGCALVVGLPMARYAFDSGLLARAKRNNACVYMWDPRQVSIPAAAIPESARQLREYNGRHCPDVGDVPLTTDLLVQLDE